MNETSLPPAERDVLASLHRLGEATSRQILESLEAFRPMGLASVVTLLRRLESKGLVSKTKGPVGKAFLYRARQQARVTFRGAVRQMVQRVFHGDSVAMVASLFETKPPSIEEVEQLQQMLDELRMGKKSKK
jgi:BlaI family transcriptional regulator, penicillinase repressor